MENELNVKEFVTTPKSCLIAPAGFGKTFTIAVSVNLCEGKQLILTHTNRGIHAIKKKIEKQKIPKNKYTIRTIDGFAKTFINSYPKLSETTKLSEENQNYWSQAILGFSKLLELDFIKKVIKSSYTGLFVDEYQDCNLVQHQVVMKLSNIIPTRLLGDPLQGIYAFDKESPIVDMNSDIPTDFVRYNLFNPWRWNQSFEFGEWLKTVREDLVNGRSIDLTKAPKGYVKFAKTDINDYSERNKLIRGAIALSGSVVVINKVNNICHSMAKVFSGQYQSDEEISSEDLIIFADKLDMSVNNYDYAYAIFWMAGKCFSTFRTKFGYIVRKQLDLKQTSRSIKHKSVVDNLQKLIESNELKYGLSLMKELQEYHIGLYRRELWEDAKKTIELFLSGKYVDAKQVAKNLRNKRSIIAKAPPSKLISRVYLVKGLEFDHCVILNPESFNDKELYVALTRASSSLTIISSCSTITPFKKKSKIIKKTNGQLQLF